MSNADKPKAARRPDPKEAPETPAGAAEDRPGFDLGDAKRDAPKGDELKGIATVPIGGGEAPMGGAAPSDKGGDVDPGAG